MNTVILEGKLVREPEVRYLNSGKCMCKFTVVTNDYEKDSGSFHSCVAWNEQAEQIGNMGLAKGARVSLVGKGKSGNYKNKDGKTVYTYDIWVTLLDANGRSIVDGKPKAKQTEEQTEFSEFGKAIADKPDGVDF